MLTTSHRQFALTVVPADAQRLTDLASSKLPGLQKTSTISAGKIEKHPLGEFAALGLYTGS
jgi:hypothetical protein